MLPSSTNPTRPFTINTIDEHLDMLMVCHHLDAGIAEDLAFAESRIRRETIAAEDILHDLGAISMFSSDSQAMGRVGEVIIRCWQTAHKMKQQRGALPGDGDRHDNTRIKRYIAKLTLNQALAHGIVKKEAWTTRGQRLDTTDAGRLSDDGKTSSWLREERLRLTLAQLREALTLEEQGLLRLRVDQGLSWAECAQVLARGAKAPTVDALMKRFERVKARLGALARGEAP